MAVRFAAGREEPVLVANNRPQWSHPDPVSSLISRSPKCPKCPIRIRVIFIKIMLHGGLIPVAATTSATSLRVPFDWFSQTMGHFDEY